MTRRRRAREWGLFDAPRHCLWARNSRRKKNHWCKNQRPIRICNKKRSFIWFLIYGDFLKICFGYNFFTFVFFLCYHREKCSAQNNESKGIKHVKVCIEIKKFVFQRSAVCEFFLPLRGLADIWPLAGHPYLTRSTCWQSFRKIGVSRLYSSNMNRLRKSLLHLLVTHVKGGYRQNTHWLLKVAVEAEYRRNIH